MIKLRTFLFFTATLFLTFNFNNISFATEDADSKVVFPDYSYEFVGKDTCENFNRKMFVFNLKLNKYLLRPVNIVWASVMPKYCMDRLQSCYNNITFPIRVTSCLVQKDFKSSKTETVRFLTNTTLGVAGLWDPALTKFKIEPRQEDMAQALAYRKVKQGPYLVLPFAAQGTVRDFAGKVLDIPLNPTSYVIGPVAAIAKGVSMVNRTTYNQPIAKMIDVVYADPYEVTKKLHGIDVYIKNSNLDRREVLAELTSSQNIVKINNVSGDSESKCCIKPDVQLENYNPQCPVIDSMRTAMFDYQKPNDSIWSEMSVWNRTFDKKFKVSSVNIDPKRPNYRYRCLLQKDKTAPLAIIYPAFGEGITSDKSRVQAKMLYEAGYSVVVQGSAFHWEFIKSMPDCYRPGAPAQDARYLRMTTAKILNDLNGKGYSFRKKILVGTSFGAMTSLFVAQQEEKNEDGNNLGISYCIAINPPVELFYALKQLDKYTQEWKNDPSDIKLRTAIAAEKIVQVSQNLPENLPFTEDEAKLTIGFVMKQKLSDVVFTIENCSRCKKSTVGECELYETLKKMSFYDYAQKYLPTAFVPTAEKSFEQLSDESSLYPLAEFLQNNNNYRIYHCTDDYFANEQQLAWLKNQTGDKSVFFSNGSHLGCLYRQEFINDFKKQIKQ